MLGHLNTQLSQFRREQIRPALKPEYKAICSAEIPADSQHLFGDDLAKQLKDANEASKISHNVTHTTTHKIDKGKYRYQGQRDSHHGKGQRKDFLWQGHYRPFKRRKPFSQGQKAENKS